MFGREEREKKTDLKKTDFKPSNFPLQLTCNVQFSANFLRWYARSIAVLHHLAPIITIYDKVFLRFLTCHFQKTLEFSI